MLNILTRLETRTKESGVFASLAMREHRKAMKVKVNLALLSELFLSSANILGPERLWPKPELVEVRWKSDGRLPNFADVQIAC